MPSMRSVLFAFLFMSSAALAASPASRAHAQANAAQSSPARDATRERLRALLAAKGPGIHVNFTQSTKNPYNFIGTLTQGLKNSDSLEIVISVTKSDTIGFRVYPHYKGGYINLAKVKDTPDFAHKLLRLSDENFLFWGVDDTSDTFTAYTITLESGFPDAAIDVVLRSIPNTDIFVGQLRPAIDGSDAVK